MEKLPPIEKVYEAWSALADNRVDIPIDSLPGEGKAYVRSSDGAKTYTVTWRDNATIFTSNDNATYWRGYAGYPLIAVMMLLGLLPLDRSIASLYANVNWTQLNAAHRADYAAALFEIQSLRGILPDPSALAATQVMDALSSLPVAVRRGSLRPPK